MLPLTRRQFIQLETVAPSGDVKKDMKTNLEYIRGLLAKP
jgi:hypothetical protein